MKNIKRFKKSLFKSPSKVNSKDNHRFLKYLTQAFAFSLLVISLPATAQSVFNGPEILPLSPEKNVSAQLQKLDAFGNYELLQPDGSTVILEKVNRFEVGDFNFDKYPDFLAIRDKGFNTQAELFAYDAKTKRFVLSEPPADVQEKLLCPAFSNLKIISSEDKKTSELVSSCMAKRSTEVHFDYLKYDSNGKLWLSQQYRHEPLTISEELLPFTDLPWGITEKMIEYSPEGQIIQEQLASHALDLIVVKVLNSDVVLYGERSNDTPVLLKLAPSQICNLIELDQEWMQLECARRPGENVIGWLYWPDFIHEKSRPFIITELKLVKQY